MWRLKDLRLKSLPQLAKPGGDEYPGVDKCIHIQTENGDLSPLFIPKGSDGEKYIYETNPSEFSKVVSFTAAVKEHSVVLLLTQDKCKLLDDLLKEKRHIPNNISGFPPVFDQQLTTIENSIIGYDITCNAVFNIHKSFIETSSITTTKTNVYFTCDGQLFKTPLAVSKVRGERAQKMNMKANLICNSHDNLLTLYRTTERGRNIVRIVHFNNEREFKGSFEATSITFANSSLFFCYLDKIYSLSLYSLSEPSLINSCQGACFEEIISLGSSGFVVLDSSIGGIRIINSLSEKGVINIPLGLFGTKGMCLENFNDEKMTLYITTTDDMSIWQVSINLKNLNENPKSSRLLSLKSKNLVPLKISYQQNFLYISVTPSLSTLLNLQFISSILCTSSLNLIFSQPHELLEGRLSMLNPDNNDETLLKSLPSTYFKK